jgi:hypothetical protein
VSEESGTVGSGKTIAGLRRPIVGHIITIGQVHHHPLRSLCLSPLLISLSSLLRQSISTTLHGNISEQSDGNSSPSEMANRTTDTVLRLVMDETGLMEQWDLFEKNELNTFLERQVAISSAGDANGIVSPWLSFLSSLLIDERSLRRSSHRKQALNLIQKCNSRWLSRLCLSTTILPIGHQPIRSATSLLPPSFCESTHG